MATKTKKPVRYLCTACGNDLNDFAFDPRTSDMKGLVQGFANCKDTGKLAGLYCSKMFIAGGDEVHLPRTSKKASARKVSSLKNSILERIAVETGEAPAARKRSAASRKR
jgi:hypothetical protein